MGPYSTIYDDSFSWQNLCVRNQEMYNQSTLLGAILNDKRISTYAAIVKKAMLEGKFNSDLTNMTLFVPVNESFTGQAAQYFLSDVHNARLLVDSYSINAKALPIILVANKATLYNTMSATNPIFMQVDPTDQTLLVNEVGHIMDVIDTSNGILYIIDDFTKPYVAE